MNRKKILFLIYSISGGGAEKQMRSLLAYIDRDRLSPHLGILQLNGNEKEILPDDVILHDLSTRLRPSSFFMLFKLARLVREVRPYHMVSFTWGINLIALAVGLLMRIPVTVSERIYTFLSIQQYSFWHARKWAISVLYKRAFKIITVSNDVKDGLIKYFHIPADKIEVVYNGIDPDETDKKSTEYNVPVESYILSCGSLTAKKNFEFLIESVSLITHSTLVILGLGPLKSRLEQKARELDVHLYLPGYIKNPYPYFKKAKVFVLTSAYEGFPNVILESMACGVPVVAVDCPGGIREIIDHGKNGLLIRQNDKKELAAAVKKVIKDPSLSKQLVNNARENLIKFNIRDMVKRYENIILSDMKS